MYDIAVVGSRGFLGATIARVLHGAGHRIHHFTRETPLLADDALAPAARSATAIVWAAGAISPTVAHAHPELVATELDQFRRTVAEVAAQTDAAHFVLLSSGGTVYGAPGVPPFRESEPLHPSNAYGEYKLAQERILEESGVPATSLRVANAYGPGQQGARGQGVLAVWMRSVLAGDPITIHGSGAVARDYVYVDDVADAVARVIGRSDLPATLNVGSGRPTELDELVSALTGVVGADRVRVERRPSRGVDAASTWLDVSLALETIGWDAATDLATGIERMWHWVEES